MADSKKNECVCVRVYCAVSCAHRLTLAIVLTVGFCAEPHRRSTFTSDLPPMGTGNTNKITDPYGNTGCETYSEAINSFSKSA